MDTIRYNRYSKGRTKPIYHKYWNNLLYSEHYRLTICYYYVNCRDFNNYLACFLNWGFICNSVLCESPCEHGTVCLFRDLRDTPISEIFTSFTYICIIYWLCIIIVHKDR